MSIGVTGTLWIQFNKKYKEETDKEKLGDGKGRYEMIKKMIEMVPIEKEVLENGFMTIARCLNSLLIISCLQYVLCKDIKSVQGYDAVGKLIQQNYTVLLNSISMVLQLS